MVSTTFPNDFEENENEMDSDGEPPQFSDPDSLNKLVPKPSGNMIRLRCAATGNIYYC